jgi:hypothetical protein
MRRYTVISIPGRDDDDAASYFVLDTLADAATECATCEEAEALARRLNGM